MVTNDRQSAQLASTLAWLGDNVRENKAQLGRLLQQIEQSQTQVWDLAHRLHRAEEIATQLVNQVGVVPRLETELASFGDRVIRAEDRQVGLETRVTDLDRVNQVVADHVRTEINELVKRVDGGERLTQGWSSRFDTLEEAGRRAQEATSIVKQRIEDLDRFVELVDQRGARTADALKRGDQESTRLGADIDALQKQDTLTAERFQVYAEIVKRFEDQLALVAQQTDVRREFNEKLELQRSGLRRNDERLNALESNAEEVRESLDDHQRALASLDARERGFRERQAALQEELASYRAHVSDQFQKAQTTVERQKRRRIEDIEREIRELKVNAYRPQQEA